MAHSGYSHNLDDPQITFEKKFDVSVTNPFSMGIKNEPVHLSSESIKKVYPDFNENFFRVKHKPDRLEPLDIFSQIVSIPGKTSIGNELVFQLDMAPKEKIILEIQYNPTGNDMPDYPVRTKSYAGWYKDKSNIAWENELTAYRWYGGIVDCFGKSFPHLCLDKLRSDSYHHERLWGQDYYMVGKSAGLGGIGLFDGDKLTKCYGSAEPPLEFSFEDFGGGPVMAGAVVSVNEKNSPSLLTESSIITYHGRYENRVRTVIPNYRKGKICAPGMTKFKDEKVSMNENDGFLLAWGRPVDEYGIIGTAIVWDPSCFVGIHEIDDTRFIKLTPDNKGIINYFSIGVWYRGSADQPTNMAPFMNYVYELSHIIKSPLKVKL